MGLSYRVVSTMLFVPNNISVPLIFVCVNNCPVLHRLSQTHFFFTLLHDSPSAARMSWLVNSLVLHEPYVLIGKQPYAAKTLRHVREASLCCKELMFSIQKVNLLGPPYARMGRTQRFRRHWKNANTARQLDVGYSQIISTLATPNLSKVEMVRASTFAARPTRS